MSASRQEISNRRSGRTTRIIDAAVQEFFTEGAVTTIDHFYSDRAGMVEMNKYCTGRIVRRLEMEHEMKLNEHFKIQKSRDGLVTLVKI